MDIYSPLANRLGISKIKIELDDLSMKYLMPDVYKSLRQEVHTLRPGKEAFYGEGEKKKLPCIWKITILMQWLREE